MTMQTLGWFLGVVRSRKGAVSSSLVGVSVIFLGWLWFSVPAPQSQFPAEPVTVVAGGMPTPLGGVFATDGTPAIGLGVSGPTDTGMTAFLAFVNEGRAPLGLFQALGQTITTVVAVGDPTPLGGTFTFFAAPTQNQAGEVVFSASIEGGDVAQGIFLFSAGQLHAVAALGESTALKALADFPTVPTLNNRGEVAFRALLPEGDKETPGIFVAAGETVEEAAADGDLASSGEKIRLSADDTFPLVFNDAGEVAFVAEVTADSGMAGLFVASPQGDLTQLVTSGEPTPLGGTYVSLSRPGLNNAGEVVFGATIADGAATQGLFLVSQGQVTVLVAEGDPTPVGGRFRLTVGMGQPPVVNDQGAVAFGAQVIEEAMPEEESFPVSGVFVSAKGQIIKAVVEGDPSPLGGSFLGGPVSFQLGNSGTVLFMSIVDTDGDGNPNNQGIFAVRP